jgi:uncharacterized protein YjiS (DUF1127 family)
MRYERPWHGDVVAAPVCAWSDHEDCVFEGFGGRSWDEADSRADRTETEQTDFTDRPTWSSSIASKLAGLWSRIRRHREIRRIRAASGMIDDRTLADIGVSRYEIECARDTQDRR